MVNLGRKSEEKLVEDSFYHQIADQPIGSVNVLDLVLTGQRD